MSRSPAKTTLLCATAMLAVLVAACDVDESVDTQPPQAVTEVAVGVDDGGIDDIPDDRELIERGETLFRSEGCIACHRSGDRQRGPQLEGVTEKRSAAWIAQVIMHPGDMRQHDDTARQLAEQYPAPMPETNLDPDQTRALIAYLATL